MCTNIKNYINNTQEKCLKGFVLLSAVASTS